jgi:hypothetical protein
VAEIDREFGQLANERLRLAAVAADADLEEAAVAAAMDGDEHVDEVPL